jgi:hypothetical protein
MALLEELESWELRDLQDIQEQQVRLVILAEPVSQVQLDHRVIRVFQDQSASLDQQDLLVLQDLRVSLVQVVPTDPRDL